jgi:intracellular sulfur oxidation DsrE/DsrF family protein
MKEEDHPSILQAMTMDAHLAMAVLAVVVAMTHFLEGAVEASVMVVVAAAAIAVVAITRRRQISALDAKCARREDTLRIGVDIALKRTTFPRKELLQQQHVSNMVTIAGTQTPGPYITSQVILRS